MTGSLDITPEWAKGIIGVEGRGIWLLDQIRDHFSYLSTVAADLRARTGTVRILVDLRQAFSQPPEIAEAIRVQTAALYTPEDRVAIVVATEFQRDQMERVAHMLHAHMFDDVFAALRWLEDGQ